MPRGFSVEGGAELKVLMAELRMAPKELKRSTTKALVASVKPIVPRVRASALAIPAKDNGGEISQATVARAGKVRAKSYGAALRRSGLRQRLAAAVRSDVRIRPKIVQVAIRVDGSRLPDDQRTLPHHMDGVFKQWRHPVFGHDVWVDQQAHPWFRHVIAQYAPAVHARVRHVMAETARAAGFKHAA